jgi:type II restriction/modification system DNA methylase subunit YeeA
MDKPVTKFTETAAMPSPSAAPQKPLRFLDLPYDIRTMIYRYVPERVKRPLLLKGYEIYHEETSVPTALFQVKSSYTPNSKKRLSSKKTSSSCAGRKG